MRFDLTVNEFTMRMFARKHLTVYGQHAWRPYIHVRDAARAIHSVLKTPNNVRARIFNVGSTGQNFRKADVLRKIQTHVAGSEIEYLANREDLRDYRVNFDKIAQELGFEATITVDAGVAELVELLYTGTLTDLDDPKFRN
jgi:nucleoside-diphosphate-sugar epimerase